MKHVLILYLLSGFLLHGQSRINEPLPIFGLKPVSSLSKGLTGWSKSPDGQWVSMENTIPLRLNVHTPGSTLKEERKIGEDNIAKLELYPVVYGTDTLVLLVKHANNGAFEFAKTRRSWQNWTSIYYFLLDKKHLSDISKAGMEGTQNLSIPLLAYGQVEKLRADVFEAVSERVNLTRECGYSLEIRGDISKVSTEDSKKETELKLLQFQLYAFHQGSRSIEGIISETLVNGKSVYDSKKILDVIYYELPVEEWQQFFVFNPANAKFQKSK